jgi:hypothetical protein
MHLAYRLHTSPRTPLNIDFSDAAHLELEV